MTLLVWQQFIIPHFVSIVWNVLIFSTRGLVYHCVIEFVKHNFLHFNIVLEMVNATYYLFYLLVCFQPFLISLFDVRRCKVRIWVVRTCPPSHEIYCVHGWIGWKNKSISSTQGGIKSNLKLQETTILSSFAF